LIHRRVSLVAVVPLVVVLLALSGCSTNPATGVTSSSAYLNGDGNCPGAGHSFTWWYNLWDAEGNVYNGPQRYVSCSGQSQTGALQADYFGDLMTSTLHCFVIDVQYHSPTNEFMYFDANGDKNGSNYDCFTTQAAPTVETIEVPPYAEASTTGPPSSGMYSNTRTKAKNFWSNYGEWGSCMENNTRQTSAAYTQKMRWVANNGAVNVTTFKKLRQQLGYNTGAVSIGCNSVNYGDATNPDARIIYNESINWGTKRHCVTGAHEWGHQRGFTHNNQTYRIMRAPLYLDFPWC
jgi:hypothetical protein